GTNARVIANGGTAVGTNSRALATRGTSVGFGADAGNFATSVGQAADASGSRSTAVGNLASATVADTTAVGSSASVTHARSTAVGFEAASTTTDQVTLGGTGSSVRIGDIEASTQAQVGPVDVVTVDQNGTLGRQQVATAASVDNVRVSMNALAAVSEAQFNALSGRVTGLEFRLEDVDQRARGGIAAAMALGGQMVVPESSVSLSFNASTFQGEQGFAGSVSARVAQRVYVSAGVAGSTASDSTGGRVGVAFGF
ncbi:MAG: hypothetical protein AAF553_04130, partial [Pseudomonadota bacterium]